MNIALIEDPSDRRLSDYRNVPDPELIERRGIFVAEGRLVVRRLLLESTFPTRSVLVTETALTALSDAVRQRSDVPVFVVPQPLMDAVTGFNIHRGCLAIGERPTPRAWQEILEHPRARDPKPKTIVILERIGNADNVGGIFRNAAAFDVAGVLLDPMSTDPLYRKAIRTSMGAALTIPFARMEPWPDAIDELHANGFDTIALTPATDAPTLSSIVQSLGERPAALFLGHEGDGLSDSAFCRCTHRARIPITSLVDSLNVASACGIALYELARRANA